MGSVAGNRSFKPSKTSIVLTLLGVLVFFRLGVWQLDRAEEKRALIAAFASGTERSLRVTGDMRELPRYQSIELTGRYDSARQILLDNMTSARGQPGYRVLTPLQRESGDWVLVDRGWVPAGKTRQALPDVRVDQRLRVVRGQIDVLPEPGIRLGSAEESQPGTRAESWPKVMNYPQHRELTAALDRPLGTSLVLLDASQPDGYERVWKARFGFGPERHLGYAVTWFGLLATVLVTFLVVSFKKVANDDAG